MSITTSPTSLLSRNSDVNPVRVKSIEGHPMYGGELLAKLMIASDEMTFLELHYQAGVGVPMHTHTHESITYVVKGKVGMRVGDHDYILNPGDVCRHPIGVPHRVEAIEDSVMIEIKSPAPSMESFFKV